MLYIAACVIRRDVKKQYNDKSMVKATLFSNFFYNVRGVSGEKKNRET